MLTSSRRISDGKYTYNVGIVGTLLRRLRERLWGGPNLKKERDPQVDCGEGLTEVYCKRAPRFAS